MNWELLLGIAIGNYYLKELCKWELLLGITIGNYYLKMLSRSFNFGSVFGELPLGNYF